MSVFKSKKQKAEEKAAKKAAAIAAIAAKAAKIAAAKKAKINKVVRPAPAAPAAKPVGPDLAPVKKIPGHGKPKGVDPKVNIHLLGNALIDGVQYKANTDVQVPASVARAIGKSAVSMNTWKVMKEKAGLSSLRK